MYNSKFFHSIAFACFQAAGLIPKDSKNWCLHHKDKTLRMRDPKRYYEWRIEDLVPLTSSQHAKLHKLGEIGAKYCQTEEARLKRANSNKHKRGKYTIRQNINERINLSKRLSDKLLGNQVAKDRIWVNNSIISKMVYPNEIPLGFQRGRIYKRKN